MPQHHTAPHAKTHTTGPWDIRQARTLGLRVVRSLAAGLFVAVAASVLLQVAYPRSMALPQTRIGGKTYGWQRQAQITADIQALNQKPLRIFIADQELSMQPGDLGITLSGSHEARAAVSYSWAKRFTPFSLFFEHRNIPDFRYSLDEQKATAFAGALNQYNKLPQNAAVRLEGTTVTIDKGQTGYAYEPGEVLAAIKQTRLNHNMSMVLMPKTTEPEIPDHAAAEAGQALQQRLQQALAIEAAGKSIVIEPATLASWMSIAPDPVNKKLNIVYDQQKIKAALVPLSNQVYKPAEPSGVSMIDGVEVSRSGGAAGQMLNIQATAEAVQAAAVANQASVRGSLAPVEPVYRVDRGYTRSSRGIQALLDYWDQSNPGTWGVVMRDTSGNISASLNPDKQFVSASVYKIYVAYVVYSKADNGQISMDSPAGGTGKNVAGCMEVMIVRSDNACGSALGDMIGWGASNPMLHARGFGATSIVHGAHLTTPRNAADYMTYLHSGSLLSAGNQADLLSKMGRGTYRYAIPAGSTGMHAANKLGALGTYNHDVAIVYHPKGAYVLSVFSQGSNHARIRELARQIATVMWQ